MQGVGAVASFAMTGRLSKFLRQSCCTACISGEIRWESLLFNGIEITNEHAGCGGPINSQSAEQIQCHVEQMLIVVVARTAVNQTDRVRTHCAQCNAALMYSPIRPKPYKK